MIIDLFAGLGGWSEGLRSLGQTDVGLEIEPSALATRTAAGHNSIWCDVAQVDPTGLDVWGMTASPPCQTYSKAGKRKGLDDPRGQLVWEPVRWATILEPEWIACEQVPAVLPIWKLEAAKLRELGYSTWTGVLWSEQYGVPQTRERAFLLASRTKAALPPAPTHQKYKPGEPQTYQPAGMFSDEVLPWVSMAEALSWGLGDRPSPTLTSGGTGSGGGVEPFANTDLRKRISGAVHTNRDQRPDGSRQVVEFDRPAPTLTAKSGGQWHMERVALSERQAHGAYREVDEPSPTITASADNGNFQWVYERPATTVCGDPRLGWPGHHDENNRSMSEENGSLRLSIEEALILQGFRPDYPVQGTRVQKYAQVGNAVPPPVAAAVIKALM